MSKVKNNLYPPYISCLFCSTMAKYIILETQMVLLTVLHLNLTP